MVFAQDSKMRNHAICRVRPYDPALDGRAGLALRVEALGYLEPGDTTPKRGIPRLGEFHWRLMVSDEGADSVLLPTAVATKFSPERIDEEPLFLGGIRQGGTEGTLFWPGESTEMPGV